MYKQIKILNGESITLLRAEFYIKRNEHGGRSQKGWNGR